MIKGDAHLEARHIVCHGCLSQVRAGTVKCPYCGHSFANANPPGTLPVGTLLAGRYTLDKCISLDGEGVSYAAADAQTSHRVVVKEYVPVTICSARTRTGAVVPRRDREVLFKTTRMDFTDLYRALVSIGSTPGLARVYDLVEANNTAYAVTEPVVGTTLLAYLQARRVPLTQQEAIALLRPIVYAVEAMHQKGLLHRGISPETIYITADGRAKLYGFATLGLRTADSELRSQLYEGYAAPEQYSAAEFDGKYTDVYGLGAVFYRALTGRTPPAANNRRISDTLIPPGNLVDTLPAFVENALMRSMRLVATERLQTAPELLENITAPVRQKSAGMSESTKRLLLVGGGVAMVVGIIAMIVVLVFANRNQQPQSVSTPQSTSTSVSVSVPVETPTLTVPGFVNRRYTDIQQNAEYMNNFLFSVTEEFSDVFEAGYVMNQSPAEGSEATPGTVVQITVSRGPETVLMPTVVGQARVDAKAALDALGIHYIILERVNDGSYTQDYVVDCDVAAGTAVNPKTTTVTLYVAQAPPG